MSKIFVFLLLLLSFCPAVEGFDCNVTHNENTRVLSYHNCDSLSATLSQYAGASGAVMYGSTTTTSTSIKMAGSASIKFPSTKTGTDNMFLFSASGNVDINNGCFGVGIHTEEYTDPGEMVQIGYIDGGDFISICGVSVVPMQNGTVFNYKNGEAVVYKYPPGDEFVYIWVRCNGDEANFYINDEKWATVLKDPEYEEQDAVWVWIGHQEYYNTTYIDQWIAVEGTECSLYEIRKHTAFDN